MCATIFSFLRLFPSFKSPGLSGLATVWLVTFLGRSLYPMLLPLSCWMRLTQFCSGGGFLHYLKSKPSQQLSFSFHCLLLCFGENSALFLILKNSPQVSLNFSSSICTHFLSRLPRFSNIKPLTAFFSCTLPHYFSHQQPSAFC